MRSRQRRRQGSLRVYPRMAPVACGTGRELVSVLQGHKAPVRAVAFHPNGETLATGSGDSSVRLWDARSGRELAMLRHEAEIRALVFSADGEILLTASGSPSSTRNDMAVRLWMVRDRRVVRSFPFQGAARGAAATAVAFSPDGERVFAAPATEPVVYVWDRRTGNLGLS